MASGSTAMLRRAAQDCLCQASAEHLQQCAEFFDSGPFSPLVTGRASRSSCCHTLTIVKCLEPLGRSGCPTARARSVCARSAVVHALRAASGGKRLLERKADLRGHDEEAAMARMAK